MDKLKILPGVAPTQLLFNDEFATQRKQVTQALGLSPTE
jgi:hypothetical protein